MKTYFVLLLLMTIFSLWSVMRGSIIRAAIGLALTSAVLSVIMFRLFSPLAAVFELSVCAGLITVIFMSTISLAEPLTYSELIKKAKPRMKRFWFLPVILVLILLVLVPLASNLNVPLIPSETEKNIYNVLWKLRQLDVFGQILILFAGIFGVVIFFKNTKKQSGEK